MGDVFSIFLLSLLAMFNPTLLAAVTIMMLLPEPRRLITGYLLGAYLTSIGLGLAIVFTFHQSCRGRIVEEDPEPARGPRLRRDPRDRRLGPPLGTGGAAERKPANAARRQSTARPEHKESLPEKLLGRGSMRITFAVGALLSLPGASYFVALDKIAQARLADRDHGLAVIVFCLIQQLLLELPLFGFWSPRTGPPAPSSASASGSPTTPRRAAGYVALTLGCLLIIRGTAYLIAG